ncbi:hypothetical protein [Nocardioides sp. AE5]|uniref:hypothetical protein n=1 Tax=Nocardioides sp. AE5 TaxID=2962573 RepID=UPI0028826E7E|nr:hypothetical protein [Nocardioides sp. AE5]MDT0200379.1 hypothetical protein [Nocardioides sp. AE5]
MNPTSRLLHRTGLALAALTLALAAAGCSSDDPDNPQGSSGGGSSSSGSGSDRPMGNIADDDAIRIIANTLKADRAEWRGEVAVFHFADGSRDDPLSRINCSAISHLIADTESAELHYPDGVLDCTEALAPLN